MNVRAERCRWLTGLAAASAIMLVFASCGGSGPASADSNSAKGSDNAELFTIPQEQMAHVQVLTVRPTTLPRSLRLTGAVASTVFARRP